MPECFDTVNQQNRNLIAVLLQQIRIGFDVDLGQRIQFGATGPLNLSFHFIAEMTARLGVKNQFRFFGHPFLPDNLMVRLPA